MLEVFKATFSQMMVMFLCLLVGFILNKKKLVPDNGATVLSKLENYVLVPSLIINTFMDKCTVEALSKHYKLVLYSAVAVAVGVGLAYLLSGLFEKDEYKKNIYKYAIAFGNFSFMGNAIVPAILGGGDSNLAQEWAFKYLLFSLALNLVVYTWGIIILIPKDKKQGKSPIANLLNPTVISIVIGIILGLTGAQKFVPVFIKSTLSSLQACMGPVAMVLTGFVIGGYNIAKLLKNKKVYIMTALRLIIFPVLFVGILMLLKADIETITLCFFAYSTPMGLNTVIFPAAYGGDTETGAAMAMISHTLCIVSIPLMYALLKTVL